jgi:hypothetical protein
MSQLTRTSGVESEQTLSFSEQGLRISTQAARGLSPRGRFTRVA